MSLVCFCSPKGGVGKTSLSVNVAGVLARAGLRVLVVDLDVQNSLRLHLGVQLGDERGLAPSLVNGRSIREGVIAAGSNLLVMPFGQVSPAGRYAVSDYFALHAKWLKATVSPFPLPSVVCCLNPP